MIVASKGAAGVTGAGLATLGGGLAAHRPDLVAGVGLIVGVDRFMSEARALTNFSGNAVATLVIGHWVKEIDRDQAERVFAGEDPFDDTDMLDEDRSRRQHAERHARQATSAHDGLPGRSGRSAPRTESRLTARHRTVAAPLDPPARRTADHDRRRGRLP